ncbi:MAG: hypothetical protein A2252_09260 [Elusimicrobia bacterium RIFOXYA2_FULL_39_19]|nr:MAG: hypothetical protein A2252_09260 [Elusimicrobia bacterium RIFOXYA2_FULL_39_19]
MYGNTKTWNPFKGCEFSCIYCKPSFQGQAKRQKHNCLDCYAFKPHEHKIEDRAMPSSPTVFFCGNADISFARPDFIRLAIARVKDHLKRCPYKQFYFQSKNPKCFEQYLGDFPKGNSILLTTLETNRDEGYNLVSQSPVPSQRYEAFKAIDWPRKIVTIEPIMDFDHDIFLEWITSIKPEAVWIGYNSHPDKVQLPEPSLEKTQKFIAALKSAGIEVKEKDIREAI